MLCKRFEAVVSVSQNVLHWRAAQGGTAALKVFCLLDIYCSLLSQRLRCCLPLDAINTGIGLQIRQQIPAAVSPLIACCLRTTNYWRCGLHVKHFSLTRFCACIFGHMHKIKTSLICICCSVLFLSMTEPSILI